MKALRSRLLLSLAATLLLVAEAGAVVIDFADVTPQDNVFGLLSVTSKGYDISTNGTICAGPGDQFSRVNADGIYIENVVTEPAICQIGIHLVREDGGVFALNSFDVFGFSAPGLYFGTLEGGASANLGVAIGTGDWLMLESFSVWSSTSFFAGIGLDNINVTAVPVPAAVWLFVSALGLMAGTRLRRH